MKRIRFIQFIVGISVIFIGFTAFQIPHFTDETVDTWNEEVETMTTTETNEEIIEKIKARILFRCKRIHMPTEPIKANGDVLCIHCVCPFKEHMLNEMGDSVFLCCLISRTGIYPYTD